MKAENVLIICWDFPPNNAIGGRRWAKIAKVLLKLGHRVSVIEKTPKTPAQNTPWISQEELSQISLFSLSAHILCQWLNGSSSLFGRIKSRLAKVILSYTTEGTIFDKTLGIEEKFQKLLNEVVILKGIDTVFVTGAPFNLMYYTAKLKTSFPGVKIVADYRDPWINAQNYGMKGLSGKQLEAEMKKQNFVFENVDVISAPNSFLLDEIKDSYTGAGTAIAKFIELPHAFDPDDVYNGRKNPKTGSVKIVYAGTLYIGIEESLKTLSAYLSEFERNDQARRVSLDFYCPEETGAAYFSQNKNVVKFHQPIGNSIFKEIAAADYIMILLSEHNKNYLTSKFFEFLPYNKPYLYLGPEGYVAEKIENEKLGFCIRSFGDFVNALNSHSSGIKQSPDISVYTFESVTKEFLAKI